MKVIIVGGGATGLAAAVYLHRAGAEVQLLEATDRVGGRIKTEQQDGFLLDHGFQVLQTAYSEAIQLLDFQALNLHLFDPGAIVLDESGQQHAIGDPRRKPSLLLSTLFAPVGSLADKWALLRLSMAVIRTPVSQLFEAPETTTDADLTAVGIGPRLKSRFLEPFFNGIFLNDLNTSSRMFRFVLKMFAEGHAALPAGGMEAIPRQLAAHLPPGSIRLNTVAATVADGCVTLTSGEELQADQVVLATNPDSPLTRRLVPASPRRDTVRGTTCMYFSANGSPASHRMLMLCNRKGRLVNHVAVLSDIAPGYAPPGKVLISVTLANGIAAEDPANVLAELSRYFSTAGWEHLRTFVLPGALPDQQAVVQGYAPRLGPQLVYAGDYALYGSLNAALASGRMAAEAVLEAWPRQPV